MIRQTAGLVIFIVISLIFLNKAVAQKGEFLPSSFEVVWTSQSFDSFDNMPLSGCKGAGANVWMQNETLWLYLAHNGAYSEDETLLKLGAVKIRPVGIPLGKIKDFKQILDLQKAQITISFTAQDETNLNLNLRYVGENLTITAKTSKPVSFDVSYGNWRTAKSEAFSINKNGISFLHRNQNSNFTLKQAANQNIPENSLDNAVKDRISGGFITARGGLNFVAAGDQTWQKWSGKAFVARTKNSTNHLMVIATGAAKNLQVANLEKHAVELCDEINLNTALEKENKRWKAFWQRSYIKINSDAGANDSAFQIGHNYQLFRYMLACNSEGEFPLKFNGGIFTVEAYGNKKYPHNNEGMSAIKDADPDYRRWGNMFMAQNQRWLGWPAVAGGDDDLMNVSRKFYRDRYTAAKQRAKNLGAEGACFVEPLSLAGLCCVAPNKLGTCNAPHLKYHFVMGLENAWQALCMNSNTNVDIRPDIPWMVDVVRFYDSFYQNKNREKSGKPLNDKEKLVIYPCNGLELTGNATNPVETVAALKAVINGLIKSKDLSIADKSYLTNLQKRIPELPVTTKNGVSILNLADTWEALYNGWELPELYSAWPYRLIGITKPGTAQIGIDTWNSLTPRGDGDPGKLLCKYDYSWMPTLADMAALGLTGEAGKRAIAKLSYQAKASPDLRFTAYFGPGHDWMPDHNWGGSGMVGLQEMLMASDPFGDGKIYLLPAWPKEWNVDFKLYAPKQTIVEASVRQGKVVSLKVTPGERRKDIVINTGFKISDN